MSDDPRFGATKYIVEASSFEQMELWKRYNEELKWKEDLAGLIITVGAIEDRPVVIHCTWAILLGSLVLFLEPTSKIVDYIMIEDWLVKHCNPIADCGKKQAYCYAENFHDCIEEIRHLEKLHPAH